jgi:hypothetical protein
MAVKHPFTAAEKGNSTQWIPVITSSPNFSFYQSAYQKHHSTASALLTTLDAIYTACDHSSSTLLAALDLSVAFNNFDHQLLIIRLKTVLKHFRTVLSYRQHSSKMANVLFVTAFFLCFLESGS